MRNRDVVDTGQLGRIVKFVRVSSVKRCRSADGRTVDLKARVMRFEPDVGESGIGTVIDKNLVALAGLVRSQHSIYRRKWIVRPCSRIGVIAGRIRVFIVRVDNVIHVENVCRVADCKVCVRRIGDRRIAGIDNTNAAGRCELTRNEIEMTIVWFVCRDRLV